MEAEKIGLLIKELRKKSGLTQNEFANKYNVTYQAVSKWENGKSIPDVTLLKQICNDYNVSLDSIIGGELINNKNKKIYILLGIIALVAVILSLMFFKGDDIKFKTITSNCDDFNIYGSLVYNKNDSHLHLSNVTYCGGDDLTNYKEIECTLYEQDGNNKNALDTCKYDIDNNMKLENYLEEIEFHLENFSTSCKNYGNESLFIEINAKDEKGKITNYKIPLNIDNTCK